MIDLRCGDCLEILKDIPDKSVDLVIIDPPYEFDRGGGGGAFGSKKRNYHKEYLSLYKETGSSHDTERLRINAFDLHILDELCRVMKNINIYIYGVVRHSLENYLIISMIKGVLLIY